MKGGILFANPWYQNAIKWIWLHREKKEGKAKWIKYTSFCFTFDSVIFIWWCINFFYVSRFTFCIIKCKWMAEYHCTSLLWIPDILSSFTRQRNEYVSWLGQQEIVTVLWNFDENKNKVKWKSSLASLYILTWGECALNSEKDDKSPVGQES